MRLLLIEDEPLTIRMLAKGLREQAYAVDVAESAHAASTLVVDHDYDLIVLDLGLPDVDGLTLCRRIRDAGTTAPILILTARDGSTRASPGSTTAPTTTCSSPSTSASCSRASGR